MSDLFSAPSPQRGEGRGEGEPRAPVPPDLRVGSAVRGNRGRDAPLTMPDRIGLDLLRRFDHLELSAADGCWYPPNSAAWGGVVCIKGNVADYLCAIGHAVKRDAPPEPWQRGIAQILVATEAGRTAG